MTDKKGHYTYGMFVKEIKERLEDALNPDDIRFYERVLKTVLDGNNPRVKKDAIMKSLSSILDKAGRDIEKIKKSI
jgi:hypothetical protein